MKFFYRITVMVSMILVLSVILASGSIEKKKDTKKNMPESRTSQKDIYSDYRIAGEITTNIDRGLNNYRSVYLHVGKEASFSGNVNKPFTVEYFKVKCNDIEIKKKNNKVFSEHIQNFDDTVSIKIFRKTLTATSWTKMTEGTGSFKPLKITFPPLCYGYKYNLLGAQSANGFKLSWVPGSGHVTRVILKKRGGSNLQDLQPEKGKDFLIFENSLFQPEAIYLIDVYYQAGIIPLKGKFSKYYNIKKIYHHRLSFSVMDLLE